MSIGRFRIAALIACGGACLAGLNDRLAPPLDHPAIQYRTADPADPVSTLNASLVSGAARLRFEDRAGYLRSLLELLNIPVESQIAVFSKTSLQAGRIEPRNPRAIYFNDAVAVAWMRGGFIEVASHDPRQGAIFYALPQEPGDRPVLRRRFDCLTCHVSDASLGVPGTMIRSVFTGPDGVPQLIFGASLVDHRTPFNDRWGGYYVTGTSGAVRHMGNATITNDGEPSSMVTPQTLELATLEGKFDTSDYLSPFSDAVALMVFDHQMHMHNLITRVGWEVRAAQHEHKDLRTLLRDAAVEFVDYLFFVDEAPLPAAIARPPLSGFADKFARQGPRDSKGRSLRDLDLQRRTLRYPCSYMIYSDAFDALPQEAKSAIYERMWQVLSGKARDPKYGRLSPADRRSIVEILRETKKDLPGYFVAGER